MNEENPNDNGSVRVRKRKEIEDMPRVGDPNITLHSVECVFRRFLPPPPRHTKENNNFSVFPLYRIEKEESEIRVVFQQYLNRQSPKRMDAVTSRQTQYNSPSVLNGRRAQQHRAVHFSKVKKNKIQIQTIKEK